MQPAKIYFEALVAAKAVLPQMSMIDCMYISCQRAWSPNAAVWQVGWSMHFKVKYMYAVCAVVDGLSSAERTGPFSI